MGLSDDIMGLSDDILGLSDDIMGLSDDIMVFLVVTLTMYSYILSFNITDLHLPAKQFKVDLNNTRYHIKA